MTKVRKFNAGMALGSLTAAVALFAGVPVASAQTLSDASDTSVSGQAAPGGGSFPGSFLVPGTNTSLKIGGVAKGVYIYDASASFGGTASNVEVVAATPLEGSAQHQLHGSTRIHAKQSFFAFDARTPTAWGELDTFILTDFFGNQSANSFAGSNTENARLVLAYGTLGPFLGGQTQTVFFDGDAVGESVDPTVSIGVSNGLTNRQPQFRYTFVGAGGFSAAVAVEQPVWEVVANDGTGSTGIGGIQINRYPDFTGRVRLDQSWGHVQLAGVIRQQEPRGIGTVRFSKTGWGINLTAHANTFGKDTLRGGFMVGQAIGHYMSQMGAGAGVEATSLVTTAGFRAVTPTAYGAHIDYTHWWTNELRSTAQFGYERLNVDTTVLTAAAAQNGLSKMHIGATINLVWSPVPQVDLGVEYDWAHRVVAGPNPAAGIGSQGMFNRFEAEAVFKF